MKKIKPTTIVSGALASIMVQLALSSVVNAQTTPTGNSKQPVAVSAPIASPSPGLTSSRISPASITKPISTPTAAEIKARLRQAGTNNMANAAARQAELQQRAHALGLPLEIPGAYGEKNKLAGITPDGGPLYVVLHDAAAADTVNADNLWPQGSLSFWNDSVGDGNGHYPNGSGQIVGLWDPSGVPRNTHEQFGSTRVQWGQYVYPPPTTIGMHATWVAGMLASSGASDVINYNGNPFDFGNFSIGSAFSGSIHSYVYDSSQFTGEIQNEAGNGMPLSSHSYGLGCGWHFDGTDWIWYDYTSSPEDWKFGSYMGVGGNLAPQALDTLSVSSPFSLLVYSAGNDRSVGPGSAVTYYLSSDTTKSNPQTTTRDWNNGDDGGYDSLNPTACAKDTLTVGGVYDIGHGYSAPADVVSYPFSSAGPTDDGRIKPDVVAPALRTGTGDRNSIGLTGFVVPDSASDTAYYVNVQGTSFSAPTVAGALALALQDRDSIRPDWVNNGYPTRSSTLRALAIETADEAGPSEGPDFIYGYGLFDAQAAVDLMAADANSTDYGGAKPYVKEVLLQTSRTIEFHVHASSSTEPLKATICWNDPAGTGETLGAVDETTKRLVNDLDLRIIGPDQTTYMPWTLNPDLTGKSATARSSAAVRNADDSINNVEQVQVDNPTTTGDYTVRVTYKNSLSGGSQWVSIVLSGNTVPAVDFRITNIANNGDGSYNITWNSVVGGIYRVQGAPQVFGPWTDATPDISADHESTTTAMSAPNGNTQYYWRIARYY